MLSTDEDSGGSLRAFVIGNGPSLNDTPVDGLRNEFTIGMNRFNLLGLDWDPNWWVMVDVNHDDGWWNWDDLLYRDSTFLFREHDRDLVESYRKDAVFIDHCIHRTYRGDVDEWAWHLPDLCSRGGGASMAIQVAASLGHNPIYLVGCDLYKYRGPDDVDVNHFDPDYCPYKIRRSTGEEVIGPADWDRLNKRLIKAHTMARDSADSMGLTVENATVGGQLEVYPRVDINTVLNGKN
ncbi:hypothetical protein LCGC14_0764960 [marine sediment metagenome]|uniref:DUF115 domain-containing protein n=1 Tax=marine sediment metagenome TaxID=412755 RepID=A0A0F9QJW8_9ZZZZ